MTSAGGPTRRGHAGCQAGAPAPPILGTEKAIGTRRVVWTEKQTLHENYEKTGLVLDPNAGFGRNKKSDPIKPREQRLEEDGETYSDDDGERPGAAAWPSPHGLACVTAAG